MGEWENGRVGEWEGGRAGECGRGWLLANSKSGVMVLPPAQGMRGDEEETMPIEKGPAVGDAAPDFRLPDQYGKERCLQDYAGGWHVLYAYPKDNTSG